MDDKDLRIQELKAENEKLKEEVEQLKQPKATAEHKMAKAMLIMDMPSSCKECPCVDELGYIRVCHCTGEVIESGYAVRRQDNCPLREVPQKQNICGTYNSEYFKQGGKPASFKVGYNACIDEILGGTE